MLQQKAVQELRQQLYRTISLKIQEPTYTPKFTLDWKKAELHIISSSNNTAVLNTLLQFEKICLKNKIPCFHSFFVLQWAVNHPSHLQSVEKQIKQLSLNKSQYQRIVGYIKMRQSLLNQITKFSGKGLNDLFQSIDQIRSLNFEIITLIKNWKQEWRFEQHEPLFYERGVNYLLKINNDNADMINLANFKKTKFISPPNPFFLSEDGNFSGMSQAQKAQIDTCINLISKQRIFDIKLAFQGAIFISQEKARFHKKRANQESRIKNEAFSKDNKLSLQRQVRQNRQALRQSEIKKIYAFKESVSSSKLRALKQESQKQLRKQYQQQKQRSSFQNLESIKKVQTKFSQIRSSSFNPTVQKASFTGYRNTQMTKTALVQKEKLEKKMIFQKQEQREKEKGREKGKQKQKEKERQRQRIKSSIKIRNQTKRQQPQIQGEAIKYKLRENISKTLLQSKQQLKSSKLVEVREIKPKIKLISQKEVVLQPALETTDNTNKLQFLSAAEESKVKSFYKPIQAIIEEGQDSSLPTKLKSSIIQKKSSTQIGFARSELNPPQKKGQVEKETKKKRNRDNRLSESALESYNQKSLSIIKIYKNSLKKSRNKNTDSILEKKMVDQSPYITDIPQSIASKEQKYTKLHKKAENQSQKQLSRIAVQVNEKSKIRNFMKEQLLQKSKMRAEVEQKLSQKEKVIEQLQSKIKQLEDNNEKGSNDLPEAQGKKQVRGLLNRQKKMRDIEQKILRSKIKDEEMKFKKSREQQIKLRERQIQMEFNKSKLNLQQAHKKKLSQYKVALLSEEKKIRKNQDIILKERKKLTHVENQLAQKELKEKLLRKIISQKQRLKQESVLVATEEETLKKLTQELKEKQDLEFQRYELMQRERLRMQQMYQSLVEHNKRVEKEIQQKQNIFHSLQQQRLQEQQMFSKTEQNTIQINEQKEVKQQYVKNQEIDLDSMKIKVKQQVLMEIMRQQQLNRVEQQKQEEIRRLKLKKIEQEVADVLRAEQEKLQLENAQFLAKVESMKRQNNINILTDEQTKSQQQLKTIINDFQEEREQNLSQAFNKEKSEEQIEKITPSQPKQGQYHHQPIKQLEKHKEVSLQQNKLKNEEKMEAQSSELTAKRQIQQVIQKQTIAGTISQKEIHPQNVVKREQTEKKIQNVQKSNQQQSTIKPQMKQQNIALKEKANPEDEIMKKYNNLLPLFRKGTSIMVQDYNLSTFISAFLSGFDKTLRQMIPWSKEGLEKSLKTKKGDIFDCGSMGWLQQKQKYYLLGNIECIDSIVKKYGCVQIHQLFHLDKSSSYQKQAIAKKIRQFQKIGFVYQKQVANNTYSIRFVILLPTDKVPPPTIFSINLTATLKIEGHTENSYAIRKTHGFSYLFARLLKQTSDKTQVSEQLKSQNNQFSESVKKQLEQGPFTQLKTKELEISEGTSSVQLSITMPFKYYRQKEKVFYLISSSQYIVDQKPTYSSQITQNVMILVQPLSKQSLDVQIDLIAIQTLQKVSRATKIRDIDAVLPIWNYSSTASLMDCQINYVFKEKMDAKLNVSSISTSFLIKHTFVEIRAPFVFMVCDSSKNQRILHSHVVSQEQVKFQKINK